MKAIGRDCEEFASKFEVTNYALKALLEKLTYRRHGKACLQQTVAQCGMKWAYPQDRESMSANVVYVAPLELCAR